MSEVGQEGSCPFTGRKHRRKRELPPTRESETSGVQEVVPQTLIVGVFATLRRLE